MRACARHEAAHSPIVYCSTQEVENADDRYRHWRIGDMPLHSIVRQEHRVPLFLDCSSREEIHANMCQVPARLEC